MYYAYGVKNSFGIDFDPVTKKLWLTENGPRFGDEINLAEPGFNSGSDKIFGIWRVNQEGKKLQSDSKEEGGGYVTVGNNPKDLVYFKEKDIIVLLNSYGINQHLQLHYYFLIPKTLELNMKMTCLWVL